MAWVSLKIEAQDDTADLISDTLMELGALSTIIEDARHLAAKSGKCPV